MHESTEAKKDKTGDTVDLPDHELRATAMDKLGLVRYCCRRHFMSHVDLIEKI